MTSYATQAQVEGYLGRAMTDEEALLFPTLEGGVADFIDTYCARTFLLSRAVSHNIDNTIGDKTSNPFQRFDGGQEEIFFDQPLQTNTALAGVTAPYIGAYDQSTQQFTLLDSQNYVFYPLNNSVKTSVEAIVGVFPYGITNIFIYGTFTDYVTPPQGIQLATATLCANILNMTDDLTSETIEGYARVMDKDFNPIVDRLLANYCRVVL